MNPITDLNELEVWPRQEVAKMIKTKWKRESSILEIVLETVLKLKASAIGLSFLE